MSGILPYGAFKCLKNVDNIDLNSINENISIGYIFEVDLEYPGELHVLHNDYQLAPKNLLISHDMLSDYCKKITDEYGIKVGDIIKLIPNLRNENNYVIRYRNRQLRLSLGTKLT